ncbi:hypothetical protein FA454_32650 [Pseudomonas aeruginosa]|nr:hypothetical protein AO935_06630 [Pseudomonas aeruginosa]KSH47135.2 hypothetical protein AO969_24505 [Pseudomonas aeruginosa]KSQ08625.2 hypothetical protein APB28_35555 [Pseudomonas aeruginosa]MCO1692285.1 hypothetical protein [Pseudomonas aeruginosa]MCO1783827.1 hypothetical protein [Pseudomonas aeruginosa]
MPEPTMNIDTTEYPIVRMENARARPVEEVLECISELLARGRPFVFVSQDAPDDDAEEHIDTRRKIASWMKANRTEIRRLIKGHLQIVSEPDQRDGMQAFSVVFARFWGYPMFVVASVEAARAKAESLLAGA